ncbi:MAG TPA: zinc-ribbon domain-containing protein [Clostridia bacterium]|nr:zinc-ribbon domain-containing protein [Clostridia bacterium]
MAFCGQCGTKVNEGARFCPNCGTTLLAAPAPEPQILEPEPEAPVEQAAETSFDQPEAQQGTYQSSTFEPVSYEAPKQQSYQQQGTYQPAAYAAPAQQSYQQQSYQQQDYQQQSYQQQGYQQQRQEREYEPDGDPKTLSTGAITMFSYSGILFFIPLIAAKHSRFARFHANQGLNILLAGIAYSIASGLLSFLFGLISWQLALVMGTVFGIGSIALFVLIILGVVNVCKGEMKPLPVIGKFQIIKM